VHDQRRLKWSNLRLAVNGKIKMYQKELGGTFYPDSCECFNIKVKHSFIDYIKNRK